MFRASSMLPGLWSLFAAAVLPVAMLSPGIAGAMESAGAAELAPDSLAAGEPGWGAESAGEATVPFPYIYEPQGSWVYDEVDRQVAQGNLEGIYVHSRLLPRALLAARVAEALRAGRRSVGLSRLARELAWEGRMMGLDLPFEDTRPAVTLGPPESIVKFNVLASAGGTFAEGFPPDFSYQSLVGFQGDYWLRPGFSLHGEFAITQIPNAERWGNPVIEDTDLQFWAPRFSAAWHGRFFETWFGHDNLRWGPGRSGGLMLGGGADPFSQLGYRIHLGSFLTATAVHGWLSQAEGRYAAYHRLEADLGKGWRVGISEGVRYDGTAPEPVYVINLIPYAMAERLLTSEMESSLSERDSLIRSNLLAAADVYWRASPGFALYGELMIDDINTKQGGAPMRLAYQVGGSFVREGGRRLSLTAEYTRVHNYTYSVYYGRDFFHHSVTLQDRCLGYPVGADVGDARLWADLDLTLDWSLTGQLRYARVGEGNGAGPWCPPDQEDAPGVDCQTVGEASGSAFAGVVEGTWRVLAGAVYAPRDNLRFEAEAGVDFVSNDGHEDGRDETRAVARVLATWRW